MSLALYECGLTTGKPLVARYVDGQAVPVDTARWCASARGADETVIELVHGRVLDVGCGPGRLLSGLAARGLRALGIDIAPAAVELARSRGVPAVRCSVFGAVPDAGDWDWVLLVDGNVGIGGQPRKLLARARDLLSEDGRILVELEGPGDCTRQSRVRLETTDGFIGAWFPWAHLGVDELEDVAHRSGLVVLDCFSVREANPTAQRWFAILSKAEKNSRPMITTEQIGKGSGAISG